MFYELKSKSKYKMIRFFSKIRKSILDEGKAGKYLKYAIGEILLVVVGILIALQINNWNEDRKDRDLEQELLLQLKDEYQSNLKELDQKITVRNKTIASAGKLLEYQDDPAKRKSKHVYAHLNQIISTPTFDPIVNDIISTDRIKLLQSVELKKLLTSWTRDITYVTELEKEYRRYRNDLIRPTLTKYTSTRTRFNQYFKDGMMDDFFLGDDLAVSFQLGESIRKQDLNVLFEQSDLEDHAAAAALWNKMTNEQSYILRKRILKILELIENDLR